MEKFNPSDYMGGENEEINEASFSNAIMYYAKLLKKQWKIVAAIIVVTLLVYVLWNRQGFINGIALATSQIPFTSGADLRFNSIDSATNRGSSSTGFF